LDSFVNAVSKAVSAFKSRNYLQALEELEIAFGLLDPSCFKEIDAQTFNAIYDAQEMTALMAELPVFEKNSFAEQTISALKNALDVFTTPEGGTAKRLLNALEPFELLLRGMAVSMKYLQRKKLRADDFPPEVSFEITADALLRLYVWSEEKPAKIAEISRLKEEFESLFEKERKSAQYYLDKADELLQKGHFEDCLQVLNQAISEQESIKGTCFIRKGDVFMKLHKYEEAIDSYMKARVVGEPKHKMNASVKEACSILLKNSEKRDDRNRWNSLMQDFL
jgi:tetratricopeptide (TPR) repeat protein